MSIPVINFEEYSLDKQKAPDDLSDLGRKFCQTFESIGVCYLINHGIPDDIINDAFEKSRQFFEQPESFKEKFSKSRSQSYGWVTNGKETLVADNPPDYKETWNAQCHQEDKIWPSVEMKTSLKALMGQGHRLTRRILDVIIEGLGIQDKQYLHNRHKMVGTPYNNSTTLRSNYYPPIPGDFEIKKGQFRCGEHSDYGSVTLLFQDDGGGLEVKNENGEFVPVPPMKGSIIINLGDLLCLSTGNRLKPVRHRVTIPKSDAGRTKARQSLVYFLAPDDEADMQPMNGSRKDGPMITMEYVNKMHAIQYANV